MWLNGNMTTRTPQAVSQRTARPLWRRVLGWLGWGLFGLLMVISLIIAGLKVEKWTRQQTVLRKFEGPMMSKNLLGMKLIEQEVHVDDLVFNFKSCSPEVTNRFQTNEDQKVIFDKLIKLAIQTGWDDIHTNSDDNSYYMSAYKTDETNGHLTIYIENNIVTIKRS